MRALAVIGALAGCGDEPCVCDVTVLASGLLGARSVAVDPTTVYWSEQYRVRAVPKAAGQATDITDTNITGVRNLQWNTGRLAWADVFQVVTWLLPQGPAITLTTEGQANYGFALDATHATFGMESGDLVQVALEGGAATTIATEAWPFDVAVNDTDAFFTSCRLQRGGVYRVSLDGGSVVGLAAETFCPFEIAINSTAVFWSNIRESDPGRWHIDRVGIDGGEVMTLVEPRVARMQFKVDEDHLYYTTGDALWRMPVDGGDSVKLAEGEGISALALDETSVYWTDSAAGTLSKAPK